MEWKDDRILDDLVVSLGLEDGDIVIESGEWDGEEWQKEWLNNQGSQTDKGERKTTLKGLRMT